METVNHSQNSVIALFCYRLGRCIELAGGVLLDITDIHTGPCDSPQNTAYRGYRYAIPIGQFFVR